MARDQWEPNRRDRTRNDAERSRFGDAFRRRPENEYRYGNGGNGAGGYGYDRGPERHGYEDQRSADPMHTGQSYLGNRNGGRHHPRGRVGELRESELGGARDFNGGNNVMYGAIQPQGSPVGPVYHSGNVDQNVGLGHGDAAMAANAMAGIGQGANGAKVATGSAMSVDQQNGPPPNAPRGPRSQYPSNAPSNHHNRNGRNASVSQRSASPEREGTAHRAPFRDRPKKRVPKGFGDPFYGADHKFKRDPAASPPQETWEDLPKDKTLEGYKIFMAFVTYFSKNEIEPWYLDADFFTTLRDQCPRELKRLARAINVASGHTHGNLYWSNYSRTNYQGMHERRKKLIAGAIFLGPHIAVCYNKKGVGIEDLSRAHSQWVTLCIKERHGLVLEVIGKRALVLWATSFEGREEPTKSPEGRKKWFRIMHKDDDQTPTKAQDVPVVRYCGAKFLDKGTFMHWSEPEWVDLEVTPLAPEGSLCYDDYAVVAEIIELPEGHQLRVRGKTELEKRAKIVEERETNKEAEKAKPSNDLVGVQGDDEDFMAKGI